MFCKERNSKNYDSGIEQLDMTDKDNKDDEGSRIHPMDIHKIIGNLPRPKNGFVLPSHKYMLPMITCVICFKLSLWWHHGEAIQMF